MSTDDTPGHHGPGQALRRHPVAGRHPHAAHANRRESARGRHGRQPDPEVAQHLQTFTDLVTQLKDVTVGSTRSTRTCWPQSLDRRPAQRPTPDAHHNFASGYSAVGSTRSVLGPSGLGL